MSQITASKTELLFHCVRPFHPDTASDDREATEPMNYGSGFHECLEGCAQNVMAGRTPFADFNPAPIAKKWGIEDAKALGVHVAKAWERLAMWLRGDNPWKEVLTIVDTEKPLATRIKVLPKGFTKLHVKSRPCGFDAETHTYDLRPGEFGGTYDLLLKRPNGELVVLDYKTGDWGDFSSPAAVPQMLTLALQTGAVGVAILHAARGSVPVVYTDPVEKEVLEKHARALKKAMARVGDGSLTPWAGCVRCPARSSCPSQDGQLLVRASSLVKAATETLAKGAITKGALHMFLQEFDRLAKRAREELRNEVRAGEVISRPDGTVLVLKKVEVENLSKASCVRALGEKKGTAMVDKLRKLGCVEKTEREELRAVKE